MKFRYVLAVGAGLLVAIILFGISAVARYQPNHYKFLGTSAPKMVLLEPDPIGWVGRQARYYVVHKKASAVMAEAQSELTSIGWHQLATSPNTFGRGKHERIDVTSATGCTESRLVGNIPQNQLSSYTIVKVTDPRMPPALQHRLARWTHPIRRIISHFA